MWPSSQSPPAPVPPPAAHAHSNLNSHRNSEQELPPPSYYSSVVQPGQYQRPVDTEDPEIHPPRVGDRAPSLGSTITFPTEKPLLVVFLRVCGCPFAEQTFTHLADFSVQHPNIQCIAVTQSPPTETDDWIISLGGAWSISSVLTDPSLTIYHLWGLGQTHSWYDWFVESLKVPITSPTNVTNLEHKSHGRYHGGSKWQQGGAFGIDRGGYVRWVWVGQKVDEVLDFEKSRVVEALVGRRGSTKRGSTKMGEGDGNGQLA